jgi:hypothetical protein
MRCGWMAGFLLAAVALASCGRETTTSGDGTPAARAATSAGWTNIVTFRGDGGPGQNTATFTLREGRVRFVFTVQPNSSGPVPFLSQMFPEGAPVSPNELRRTSCASCDGQQIDDLGSVRAGNYYLHVITSRPWTLTVQEQT